MTGIAISSTKSYDYQLISLGLDLKNAIFHLKDSFPESFDEKYFDRIYKIAQKWDTLFHDSLATRKGAL
jgi:hypothetical protein